MSGKPASWPVEVGLRNDRMGSPSLDPNKATAFLHLQPKIEISLTSDARNA
jgi:hypothetical protein